MELEECDARNRHLYAQLRERFMYWWTEEEVRKLRIDQVIRQTVRNPSKVHLGRLGHVLARAAQGESLIPKFMTAKFDLTKIAVRAEAGKFYGYKFVEIEGEADHLIDKQTTRNLPADLTPLNIKAWLCYGSGFVCGCSDAWSVITVLGGLLTWFNTDQMKRENYDTLFGGNTGLFYLLSGVLDDMDLTEHGTSYRAGWLSEDGKRLLAALTSLAEEQYDAAEGEAYDGLHYSEH